MKISIDGGQTFVGASEVRIQYDIEELCEEHPAATLQVMANHEGVVFDVFENKDGEVLGTEALLSRNLAEALVLPEEQLILGREFVEED